MISVNTPITIEGQSCILMRDVLGTAPSEKYTSQEQGNFRVWYEEESLRETREANPNTPVYGFWQTLIASGLIDTSKHLQYLFTSQNRDFGYYLYSRESLLHTGSLFNDELQRLPGPAIQDGITIEDGEEITVDTADLKLPDNPLRTHRERIQAAAQDKKKAQQQGFLSVAVVAGLGLLADTGLAYLHESHMEAYNEANTELHIAEQTLAAIHRQKLVDWPSQTQSLSNLYQVSTTLADSTIAGEISLLPNKTPTIKVSDTRNSAVKIAMLEQKGIDATQESASTTIIKWVNHEKR